MVRNRRRPADEAPPQPPQPAIGERLRQARQAQGLELAVVAERLHLKQATVAALEAEDYDRLPARVFVRGYYRNYARLLGLPEDEMLREFDARCPEGESCAGAPPRVAQNVRKEIRSNHGLVKLVTWLVVIGVLAAFWLWWQDSRERLLPEPVASQAQEAPAEASPPLEEKGAPEEEPPPSQPVVIAAPAAQAPPASPPSQADPTPRAEPPSPPEPPPAVAPRIELRFRQDSWVDVRGANRSFKLVGTRKAGEVIPLDGKPPYHLIIGNARGVTLLVNGQPWDLTPHTRRNVARLTLDP